jgi:hypothetical protein
MLDPDPGSRSNPEPDPGQTRKSSKVDILQIKILRLWVKKQTYEGAKAFVTQETYFIYTDWLISMLLDPGLHSQYGSGSRTAKCMRI